MGDTKVNYDALHRAFAEVLPQHDPVRVQVPINEFANALEVQQFVMSDLSVSAWRRYDWTGYELWVGAPSTPGVAVAVAFGSQNPGQTPTITLQPGEGVRVPQGFTQVWLKRLASYGADGDSLYLGIARAPWLERRARLPVMTHKGSPLGVIAESNAGTLTTALAGPLAVDAELVSVAVPATGRYRVRLTADAPEPVPIECLLTIGAAAFTRYAYGVAGPVEFEAPSVQLAAGALVKINAGGDPATVPWSGAIYLERLGV
jgi:hypothetical protein